MSTAAPQYVANPLKFFMKLRVGGIDPSEHVVRLEGKGARIGLTPRRVMCHRSNKPGPSRPISLGRCQVRDLGFTKPPTTTELIGRVSRFGTLCPSETAAHLQEAYIVCALEGRVSVLMEPIPDQLDTPQMLTVGRTSSGVCRISERYAHPSHPWLLDYEVVAVIPG